MTVNHAVAGSIPACGVFLYTQYDVLIGMSEQQKETNKDKHE